MNAMTAVIPVLTNLLIEVVEDRGQTSEGARVVIGVLDQQRDGFTLH
jgi:hypothetical protein